jgi:hypothetical protein
MGRIRAAGVLRATVLLYISFTKNRITSKPPSLLRNQTCKDCRVAKTAKTR